MKIAFLGPFYPFRGGISYFLELLSQNFYKLGNDVKIFNFINQYPEKIFPGKNQFEDKKKDFEFPNERVLTPYNPLTWNKTVSKIENWKPDLIILKYWIPFFAPAFGYVVSKLKKKIDTKIFYIIDNIEFHEKWFAADFFTKYALKKADLLITMSESVYKDAKKLLPNKKITLAFHPIYKGYNKDKYTKEEAKKELEIKSKKVILFFGFIKKYKGLDNLLKAFSIFLQNNNDSILLIAGEVYGNDEEYFALIRELSLEKKVIFHNKFISEDEVEKYFKAADVLVLPYKQATQSGILNIAYDMDLPVIATPVGSLPDAIGKSETGLIAKSISPNDIAEVLSKFFFAKKEDFIRNIQLEKKKYSWEKFIETIIIQTKKAAV